MSKLLPGVLHTLDRTKILCGSIEIIGGCEEEANGLYNLFLCTLYPGSVDRWTAESFLLSVGPNCSTSNFLLMEHHVRRLQA